jgi:hypothetical protein
VDMIVVECDRHAKGGSIPGQGIACACASANGQVRPGRTAPILRAGQRNIFRGDISPRINPPLTVAVCVKGITRLVAGVHETTDAGCANRTIAILPGGPVMVME